MRQLLIKLFLALMLHLNVFAMEETKRYSDMMSNATELLLKERSLGDDEICVLAEALKSNKTLTQLDLSRNNISYRGAHALAEALRTNNTLEMLSLSNNNIPAEGLCALAQALGVNNTLTLLDISYNQISIDVYRVLLDNLQRNNTLRKLYTISFIMSEDISPQEEIRKNIRQKLKANKHTHLELKAPQYAAQQ